MSEDKVQRLKERKLDQTEIEFNEACIKLAEFGIKMATNKKQRLIETGKATEDQLQDLDRLIDECKDFRKSLLSEEKESGNEQKSIKLFDW